MIVLSAHTKISKFWKEWNYASWLFSALLFFELLLLGAILISRPDNHAWIGTGVFNTGDIPVYLSYINQSKHSWLLYNLFDHGSQLPRFDGFWSLGGKLTLLGLSSIWTHEVLRWLGTLVLALAVWATAKAVSRDLKQACVTAWLILSGLSTGWLYSVWMGLTKNWTPTSTDSPDLATELAIAPVLTGGAHIILSLALQLLITRWIWEALDQTNKKSLIWASMGLFFTAFFHPYYIPLYGLISLISLAIKLYKKFNPKILVATGLLIGSTLPGAGYFIWLAVRNSSFRTHHLQINQLPLDAWYFWIITLWPFALAVIWLYTKPWLWQEYIQTRKLSWVFIWLTASVICMISPLPWTRKYTQGLLPALVIMTLPFWLFLYQKICAKKIILPLKAALIIYLAFPYIHLLQTQISMTRDADLSKYFYVSKDLRTAWTYIADVTEKDEIIISTDAWVNYLIPAFTGRYVWAGHHHESPDFNRKLSEFNSWLQTRDALAFNQFLNSRHITKIISTNNSSSLFVESLADHGWQKIFTQNHINIWSK